MKHFMEGYRSEYDMSSKWLDCLDLFFVYRRILLFTPMYGWIQSKPEMHASWKKMILEDPVVLEKVSGKI